MVKLPNVDFLPEHHIWLYIADYSPSVADQFIDEIYDKCFLLTEAPEIGQQRDELLPGIRSIPVKRYIIFYRKKGNKMEIVRVLSGYRDLETLFWAVRADNSDFLAELVQQTVQIVVRSSHNLTLFVMIPSLGKFIASASK